MTPHPDEQALEWLDKYENALTRNREADYKDLAALLARVQLAEAEWWHARGDDRMQECWERIASLRQAAGERKK